MTSGQVVSGFVRGFCAVSTAVIIACEQPTKVARKPNVDLVQVREELNKHLNGIFKECKKGRRITFYNGRLIEFDGLAWEIKSEDLKYVDRKDLNDVSFRASIKLQGAEGDDQVSFREYSKQKNSWGKFREDVFKASDSEGPLPDVIEAVRESGKWTSSTSYSAPVAVPCDAIRNNKPLASYIPSPPKVQEAQDQGQDVEAEGQAAATPDPYAFAEEGAKTFARKFKDENFTKCKDRYYTQEVTFPKMDAGKDRIYELESLPNMEVKMVPKEWTERYRLRDDHSDSFYGRIFIRSTSVKVCTDSCRPLSDNYIVVPIVFKFGEWQVEGGDRFKGVSCDELSLAQSN